MKNSAKAYPSERGVRRQGVGSVEQNPRDPPYARVVQFRAASSLQAVKTGAQVSRRNVFVQRGQLRGRLREK